MKTSVASRSLRKSTAVHVARLSLVAHLEHLAGLALPQGEEVVALLKPPWTEAHLQPGDTVNLMAPHGSCDASGRRRVELSHGQGLLVLHPDMLLSGEGLEGLQRGS
jgi:hypothetical protein